MEEHRAKIIGIVRHRLSTDGDGVVSARLRMCSAISKQSLPLHLQPRKAVSNYWYDADGERTVKTSGESDQDRNTSKNSNIVNKTMEFKSNYPNTSNKGTLKSAGSSGSTSGCIGSSAGSSANCSSTRPSSTGNGSGSFGSGSNSSSSQDFNR